MKIGVIQDKVKGVWRSLATEELEKAVKDEPKFTPNRAMVRAWWARERRRGAGYTRKMRKGREQREVERPRRNRQHVLSPEERARLAAEAAADNTRRQLREEARHADRA